MTPAQWLIDSSALARLDRSEVEGVLLPRLLGGQLGVSIVTELEVGYSAQSTVHYRATRHSVINSLIPVPLPYRAEARAGEVQAMLVERGQHRSAGVADLLIAATAEIEGLTVLHYDADFDVIAEVTGQPCEWVVPRGSI